MVRATAAAAKDGDVPWIKANVAKTVHLFSWDGMPPTDEYLLATKELASMAQNDPTNTCTSNY